MAPDELEPAKSRYMVAYDGYQHASKRVAQKFASGLTPSVEEVEEERKAIEQLAVAQRNFISSLAGSAAAASGPGQGPGPNS